MANDILFINGNRNGYTVKQCSNTLTIGEMIAILQEYDEDTPVYLRNDDGYTFGRILDDDIWLGDDEDEECGE